MQIEQHSGIDLARPRAHRQPVERGEAHRAFDAAAAGQGAHGRAAAEMRDDHAARRDVRRDLAQALGDVFVRQPVKPVASDAFGIEVLGNGVMVGDRAVAAMKRGVEAGDLRQLGKPSETVRGSARDCSADAAVQAKRIARDSRRPCRRSTTGRSYVGPPWTTR